jgi:hypothetical protein
MRRKLKSLGVFSLAVMLFAVTAIGCQATKTGKSKKAATIPVTIYKSAAIDIKSAKIEKIAVAPFLSSVSDNKEVGAKVADELAKVLSETMIYTVKNPKEVNKDLMSNGLGIKQFMEKSDLMKVGAALAVDAFFMGEVKKREIVNKVYVKTETIKEETGEGKFVTDDEGKLVYKKETKDVDVDMECRSGIGEVTIRFILYNAKSGNVIFDRIESLSEEVDAFCFRAKLDPDEMSPEQLNVLLDEVTNELVERFVTLLTPPSNTELAIFENLSGVSTFSKNLLDLGISSAKMGEWSKAIEYFKQCKEKNQKNAAAHYNLGVAYQGYGWFEKALLEIKEAQRIKSKKLYSDTIRDIKKMIVKNRKK